MLRKLEAGVSGFPRVQIGYMPLVPGVHAAFLRGTRAFPRYGDTELPVTVGSESPETIPESLGFLGGTDTGTERTGSDTAPRTPDPPRRS